MENALSGSQSMAIYRLLYELYRFREDAIAFWSVSVGKFSEALSDSFGNLKGAVHKSKIL